MLKIFYKNTCSTCRNALAFIKDNTKEKVQVVEYMKEVPTQRELGEIIKMLGITPEELVRKKEKLYKDEYKDKKLTGRQWIKAMAENPQLIERPIVIKGNKAIIGRPAITVVDFVKGKKTTKK